MFGTGSSLSRNIIDDVTGSTPQVPCTATLADGAVVALRRMLPADRAEIRALADALTPRERYLRFFTAQPGYLDEWTESLVDPSPDRFTLGAYDHNGLIGVANYIEVNDPGCAEVAIVVAHGHHHRGVGTALLSTLGLIARGNGESHLVADILAENHDMQKVMADAGWQCSRHLDGTVITVEVDLNPTSFRPEASHER